MEEKPLIVLYGASSRLDDLAASLAWSGDLHVLQYHDVLQLEQGDRPSVILFELDSPDALSILALYAENTATVLVGLASEGKAALFTRGGGAVGVMTELRRIMERTENTLH